MHMYTKTHTSWADLLSGCKMKFPSGCITGAFKKTVPLPAIVVLTCQLVFSSPYKRDLDLINTTAQVCLVFGRLFWQRWGPLNKFCEMYQLKPRFSFWRWFCSISGLLLTWYKYTWNKDFYGVAGPMLSAVRLLTHPPPFALFQSISGKKNERWMIKMDGKPQIFYLTLK